MIRKKLPRLVLVSLSLLFSSRVDDILEIPSYSASITLLHIFFSLSHTPLLCWEIYHSIFPHSPIRNFSTQFKWDDHQSSPGTSLFLFHFPLVLEASHPHQLQPSCVLYILYPLPTMDHHNTYVKILTSFINFLQCQIISLFILFSLLYSLCLVIFFAMYLESGPSRPQSSSVFLLFCSSPMDFLNS